MLYFRILMIKREVVENSESKLVAALASHHSSEAMREMARLAKSNGAPTLLAGTPILSGLGCWLSTSQTVLVVCIQWIRTHSV